MSLRETKSTGHWKTIPKKCKGCSKAIYTKEGHQVLYQCSIFGSFKKDCELEVVERKIPLPKPDEIIGEK